MGLNGYVPPIGAKKGNSVVDQFLQYRRKFQGQVAHHNTPTIGNYLNGGLKVPNSANATGATNN